MDKNEVIQKIQDIGTCDNQDDRLAMLTELQDEVSKVYDNVDSLNTTLTETKEKLTKAQETNMDFFKRLAKQKEQNPEDDDEPEEKPKEYKSYEEILKEMKKK